MNVLMLGTYEMNEYSRGRILWKGLQLNGTIVDVFLPKDRWKYARLAMRLLRAKEDVILVTGKGALFLAWLLRPFHRKPIVFDVFISDYDTLVLDRKILKAGSVKARIVWWIDKLAAMMASLNVLDTQTHVNYFRDEFGADASRFRIVPVGSDETVFPFRKLPKHKGTNVYFQGTFIPLHGTETIVRAAKLLQKNKSISFKIVGGGQTYESSRALAKKLQVKNVTWLPFMPLNELVEHMADGDISLGSFGATPKAQRVITHKAFDTLSVGRPLITADTPAHHEVFTHGKTAWLVPPNDAEALANAIRILAKSVSLRGRIAREGHRLFVEKYSLRAIGLLLNDILKSVVTER